MSSHVPAMDAQEVLRLMREGLSIQCENTSACYGESSKIRVRLLLFGEEISSDYVEIKEGS